MSEEMTGGRFWFIGGEVEESGSDINRMRG
jgi:hypothetical protein